MCIRDRRPADNAERPTVLFRRLNHVLAGLRHRRHASAFLRLRCADLRKFRVASFLDDLPVWPGNGRQRCQNSRQADSGKNDLLHGDAPVISRGAGMNAGLAICVAYSLTPLYGCRTAKRRDP